ncbi:MAG TPA: MFS transporter [Spirochaetia bacterium]|nr:MFS transporter [Spirochaetia bacterium]
MKLNRSYLSYASFLSMIIGGFVGTTFGAALPSIRESLHLSISQTGTLIAARTIGYILSSFFSGYLIDRLGKKFLACIGAALYGFGLLTFGVLPGLWINFLIFLVLGMGSGQLQLVSNALFIDLYQERRSNMMNILHFFFTLGCIFGPLYTGFLLSHGLSWRSAYLTYGVITLGLFLVFLLLRFPDRAGEHRKSTDVGSFGLLKERLVVLLLLLLGLHVSVQVGTGTWMTSYLKEQIALPLSTSANILALYWAGMAVGRLLCYRISHRISHNLLLFIMSAGSFTFLLISLLTSSPGLLLLLFALMGFFLSAFYPMVIVIGGSLFQKKSGAVVGVLSAGASISSTLLQWTMAQISEASSIQIGMVFFFALALLTIVTTLIVFREAKKAGYQDI